MSKTKESRISVRTLTLLGLLIALHVVLSRVTAITITPTLRISFGFLPLALTGWLLGPLWGAAVAAAGDVLGLMLSGSGGWLPWLTVIAALRGAIYGWFLYQRKANLLRILIGLFVESLICNVILNSLALYWMGYVAHGTAFWPWLGTRALKNLAQWPVNTVMLLALMKALEKLPSSLLKGDAR